MLSCLARCLQEHDAAAAELKDVVQRQKACIVALNKERADLAARSADPAQVAALRSEAAQLQERLCSFTTIKARSLPCQLQMCLRRASPHVLASQLCANGGNFSSLES